jgi:hypothetical protein
MRETVSFPVRMVNGKRWVDLASVALAHEVVGERVEKRPDMSFAGGHRVRHYYFKKNVHLKCPEGVSLDISGVPPESAPLRKQR